MSDTKRSALIVAPPIKRVWLDKDGGMKRPIEISEIEDKIVQKAVAMLMGAVQAVLNHARRGWNYWLHQRSSKNAMKWENMPIRLAQVTPTSSHAALSPHTSTSVYLC